MNKKKLYKILLILFYFLFLIISAFTNFKAGIQIEQNFTGFFIEMIKLIPFAFILIGLFDVWVKEESVKKHLGSKSGILAYFWMILLAGASVGGLYVAFPVAYTLFSKGAKLSIIFFYIGASAICRIPMTIFEASFLGIKFTLLRYLISLPLLIFSSILLGKYLERGNYKIMESN